MPLSGLEPRTLSLEVLAKTAKWNIGILQNIQTEITKKEDIFGSSWVSL